MAKDHKFNSLKDHHIKFDHATRDYIEFNKPDKKKASSSEPEEEEEETEEEEKFRAADGSAKPPKRKVKRTN